VLHPEGFEILHAHNGQEAIEMCRENDDIKLVLMDLKMPVMDGASAAKQIRKFRPDLPIVVQTAYFPEPDKMNVFDDLISKPIRMNDLIEKVNQYLIVGNEA
jgi:CheY-like chemotaxis protein